MSASRWSPDDPKLSIAEYGAALAAPALVGEVAPATWGRLRLKLSREPGAKDWRVGASQFVGVARVQVGTRSVPLEIRPKLPTDAFFLAEYAFGARERNAIVDRRLRADLASIRRDPTACLIAWFLADVESFARRFLRRGYELRHEVLVGAPRERLLLEEYVCTRLGEGRPQEMPCEFPDLTLDTAANRAIRATVRLALSRRRLLHSTGARAALGRRARQVLSLFAGVPDERLADATFRRLATTPQSRHYRAVLGHCAAFASGLYMDLRSGPHERDAFLWDMNSLFEEGLRGILDRWPSTQLVAERPRAFVHGPAGSWRRGSRVNPDFVLRTAGGRTLILDAKYKDTGVAGEGDTEIPVGSGRLRLSRADLYQAVAYRSHDRYPGATAGLVFPVALEEGQALPTAHHVEGFGAPVYLFFLDVGPAAERNLPAFFDSLSTALDRPAAAG